MDSSANVSLWIDAINQALNGHALRLIAFVCQTTVDKVKRWQSYQDYPTLEQSSRINQFYVAVDRLKPFEGPTTILSWLTGQNDQLNDQSPLQFLRNADLASLHQHLDQAVTQQINS